MAKWENDIDNLFKESFSGMEMTPPPTVKSNLNKSLFGKGYYRILGFVGILLLLVGGTIGAWFYTNNTKNKLAIEQSNNAMQTPIAKEETKNIQTNNNRNNNNVASNESLRDPIPGQFNSDANAFVSKQTKKDVSYDLDANFTNERGAPIGYYTKSDFNSKNSSFSDGSFSTSKDKKSGGEAHAEFTVDGGNESNPLKYNAPLARKTETAKMKTTDGLNTKLYGMNDLSLTDQLKKDQAVAELFDLSKENIDPLMQSRNKELFEISLQSKRYKAKPRFELIGGLGLASNNYGLSLFDEAGNEFDVSSSPNYQFHLQARMNIKNWYVTSGINYNYKHHDLTRSFSSSQTVQTGTTIQIDSTWTQDSIPQLIIDTTYIPVYENQTVENKDEMRMRLQTISIPVKFGYRFAFHKFYLYLGAGVRFNMPVSSNLRLLSGEGFLNTYTSVKDSPYNAFNMQLILETELQYRFNDRWGISIAPRYGYQLTSIYKSSITNNANKHVGGITVGLNYHF